MNHISNALEIVRGKAVFWDRDGILNHTLPERADGLKNASPQTFADFKLVPGASTVLEQVKEKGYMNIVATKQPDIARSKMSWEELNKMHDFLKAHAPTIDAIYVCPHDSKDNCNCRKPKPGLLLDAAKDYNLNLAECFMVGDSQTDIDASHNAGVKAIVLRTHYNEAITNADFEIRELEEIINII